MPVEQHPMHNVRSVAKTSTKILAIGALPAIVTAYFTYRTAVIEGDVKMAEIQAKLAESQNRNSTKAEAGYDVLVSAVEELRSWKVEHEKMCGTSKPKPENTATARPAHPIRVTSSGAGAGGLGSVGLGSGGTSSGGSALAGRTITLGGGSPSLGPLFIRQVSAKPTTLPRTLDDAVQAQAKK
jgi:uncharacterized membrane protein YgcG